MDERGMEREGGGGGDRIGVVSYIIYKRYIYWGTKKNEIYIFIFEWIKKKEGI